MTTREFITIVGPTATGKTLIADEICRLINAEIISADSRQVYKYLKVGTNFTPTEATQHLVSFLEPDIFYSAQEFAQDARNIMGLLFNSNKIPVIAGGTGLYIKALLEDGLTPLPNRNPEIRKMLDQLPTEELYRLLWEVDAESARRNRGNPQRLKRSLEIYEITGRPMSALISEYKNRRNKIAQKQQERFFSFGLFYRDKDTFRKIISERVDKMLKNPEGGENIIDETRRVVCELGYSRESPALTGIGYRATLDYIDGKITISDLRQKIILDTVKYAKRQMTWFRHQNPPQIWLDLGEFGSFDARKIATKIMGLFKKWKE